MDKIVLVLCSLLFVQQCFFLWQIHKLVDKVMSRSYTEYIRADKKEERPKLQIPVNPEDFGTLSEIAPL